MAFFNFNPSNVNSLECVSMNNQESKIRSEIINVDNNQPVFYPFSIKVNKCSGSCNNINVHITKMCVLNAVKNINIKVFNLISWSNQTKQIEWHETCKCKCGLNSSVCNNKQRWNKDKCRCECKKLVNKKRCDKGFVSNPSNCNCECDKSCDISEYLDHKNCKCRRKIAGELLEECIENINERAIIYNKTLHDYESSSCTLYIVLFVVFLVINISTVFIFLNWFLKKNISKTFH